MRDGPTGQPGFGGHSYRRVSKTAGASRCLSGQETLVTAVSTPERFMLIIKIEELTYSGAGLYAVRRLLVHQLSECFWMMSYSLTVAVLHELMTVVAGAISNQSSLRSR